MPLLCAGSYNLVLCTRRLTGVHVHHDRLLWSRLPHSDLIWACLCWLMAEGKPVVANVVEIIHDRSPAKESGMLAFHVHTQMFPSSSSSLLLLRWLRLPSVAARIQHPTRSRPRHPHLIPCSALGLARRAMALSCLLHQARAWPFRRATISAVASCLMPQASAVR
jgi:hypothetical protein